MNHKSTARHSALTSGDDRLQTRDRLFWIALARIWRNWRTAVVLVQPDTVVRWHRDWLRRRWTRRSKPQSDGRPPVDQQIGDKIDFLAGTGRASTPAAACRSKA